MTKRNKIIYWVSTLWLGLGMVSTAIVQIMKSKEGAGGLDSISALGYPAYMLTIIGIWKILGTVVVLIPKTPLLKEWAYAGFFFIMSGALFSHFASGSPINEMLPALLLLTLTIVSWVFRPAERKLV